MTSFQLLRQLPEELLISILERIPRQHLLSLNLASKWCYEAATPHIWKEVELVDCKTLHESDEGVYDDHDDTPIIKKLIILATKPGIASCVQVLTHQCHLPPPAIFQELPYTHFNSQTLSIDPRTIRLVQLAAKNITNLRTLRIILGHPGLTDALLRCFFDTARFQPDSGYQRVRKLWLENCRVSVGLNPTIHSHPYDLPLSCDFSGLESIRLRRLPMRPGTTLAESKHPSRFVYSRAGKRTSMHDGVGGNYLTTTNDSDTESRIGEEHQLWLFQEGHIVQSETSPLESFYEPVFRFDDLIYEGLQNLEDIPGYLLSIGSLSRKERAEQAFRGTWLDPIEMEGIDADMLHNRRNREQMPSANAALLMLQSTSATLTSLNLDWIQTLPPKLGYSYDARVGDGWMSVFTELFRCRFPHLRALQLRNCVVPETIMPRTLYLLDRCRRPHDRASPPRSIRNVSTSEKYHADFAPLEFLEAHPNLQCLAWPMDRFFSPKILSADVDADIQKRMIAVIDNLGRTLVDLRVDVLYGGTDEPHSEEFDSPMPESRTSRRRFITEFATKMTKLQNIKIEGGLPRDERREIVRALHACPLEKIVMIGVSSPLGNSWNGNYIDFEDDIATESMQGEDESAVFASSGQPLHSPAENFKYEPQWEWQGQPPMMWTIASYHRETVRELKFCGFKGASCLFSPTPITTPLMLPLKNFHNLESIVLSFWLNTVFEGQNRDHEIIQYWCNTRSPSSTALVHITDDEPEGWEKELRTKFTPNALAWHVTNFIGPFLSEETKSRKEGVHVRASFCLGDWGGIFDLDLFVGKGSLGSDVCKSFKGPREEFEPDRRKSKLANRRWF